VIKTRIQRGGGT
jgi:hypothetical protein